MAGVEATESGIHSHLQAAQLHVDNHETRMLLASLAGAGAVSPLAAGAFGTE